MKSINARVRNVSLLAVLSLMAVTAFATPEVGQPAPEFKMQDQNGDWRSLSDYRGKWVALYFYPKDDTPGCTTQACAFRDNIFAFRKIDAEIVGISLDDVETHQEFAEKYSLPFTLL
ncbi:MAG: peroxiredoxin, partial [Chromatiales bacterium]|nr:peroxiredoxin [Chromatiales bacterium]